MNKQLNDIQKNFLKDILKVMGKDDALNEGFANALGMDLDNFNELADEVFETLGNDLTAGRVAFKQVMN